MVSILLWILKIIGIILLAALGLLIGLLLLVLFVPVRYKITACRKESAEVPMNAVVRVTWLLHVLNAAFTYPKAAYVRVRVFCFTVFRSDKGKKPEKSKKSPKSKSAKRPEEKQAKPPEGEASVKQPEEKQERRPEGEEPVKQPGEEESKQQHTPPGRDHKKEGEKEQEQPSARGFFEKLWAVLKNIKYTIRQIYDKIKDIIENIRYYTEIIKSDTFSLAWKACSGRVFGLLGSILPGKLRGELRIGTGDPASTGQVMAIYGMLYPWIENHITVMPDFEEKILEGQLFIKGKITVFKAVKTAWSVYFNKDLRKLIKLFKREAA